MIQEPADIAPAEDRPLEADPISRFVTLMVGWVVHVMPILRPFQGIAERIARFVGVGAASSILYALVVILCVSELHLHHDLAAVLAFATAVPFNFIMHRRVTFHSIDQVQTDLLRYAILQGINVTISVGMMAVSVDGFGLPYAVGIFSAILLIPFMTYVVMDRWVFKQKAA